MIGSRAEVQCGNVSGVNYTWRGPANVTLPTPLTIPSISVSDDQSTYTCIADTSTNPINCQNQEKSFVLEVIDRNVINVQVQPLELNYGSDGIISCCISLNTAIGPNTSVLTVKWYHNNEQLNSSMDLKQLNATCIESNITLNNIRLEDAGDYACNVSIGNEDYVMDTQFYNFSNNCSIYSNYMYGRFLLH